MVTRLAASVVFGRRRDEGKRKALSNSVDFASTERCSKCQRKQTGLTSRDSMILSRTLNSRTGVQSGQTTPACMSRTFNQSFCAASNNYVNFQFHNLQKSGVLSSGMDSSCITSPRIPQYTPTKKASLSTPSPNPFPLFRLMSHRKGSGERLDSRVDGCAKRTSVTAEAVSNGSPLVRESKPPFGRSNKPDMSPVSTFLQLVKTNFNKLVDKSTKPPIAPGTVLARTPSSKSLGPLKTHPMVNAAVTAMSEGLALDSDGLDSPRSSILNLGSPRRTKPPSVSE
ncbi:hypothetical protein Ciccas_012495 [Cichlidogyrus casuarinus]|uniref:Uncharacterized protein n=1 Tax=Cichlidogyrus casuarinus TaxID=1844966 RepID=A0ABD2PR86_9PLAT